METKQCKVCGRELPIENFKMSRYGTRVGVCTECATEKLRATKKAKDEQKRIQEETERKDARELRLKDFSGRELMEELARRGYKGKLQYVQVQEIDIENF